jgi:uncharacterized membrane protein
VATYVNATSAQRDFASLKAAQGNNLPIEGAVVVSRRADGKVDISACGDDDTASGAWIDGSNRLVIGLFAPPLLLSTAIEEGFGALVGHLTKKHEEKKMGADLDEYFPPNSCAVAVVVDDRYLDRVGTELTHAEKSISRDIDTDDFAQLKMAVASSDEPVNS